MAKADWGTKRQCQKCGVKFYDFNKTPIICPSCGAEFNPDAAVSKLRRARAIPGSVVRSAKSKEPKSEEKDELLEELDDEDLIEDTEDLDDEDLDVPVEKEDDSES